MGHQDSQSIHVHEVTSRVRTLTRSLHPELGRVPFILQVESAEKGWAPQNFHWTLRLVDGETTVRTYTGEVAENDRSPLIWSQTWHHPRADAGDRARSKTRRPLPLP